MRVLVQLRSSPQARAAVASLDSSVSYTREVASSIPGITVDHKFGTVAVPTPHALELGADRFSLSTPRTFAFEPTQASYLVRGTLPDATAQQDIISLAMSNPDVVGVFADPAIESCIVCPGNRPVGAHTDVARLLSVPALARRGLDGAGVPLAIVDTGINLAKLVANGRHPILDAAKSWTPTGVTTAPGNHPVNHGTMCAFDAGIAAPKATLLDYAVLLSRRPGATTMSGLLSDAVLAYSKLLTLLSSMPPSKRALVVSNSWGMFDPSWDFPVGHPGNYSDNPAHPFNVIVASLEHAGADILFAAGNCGRDCPDGRCSFGSSRPICGANSHPAVLSIAGADITGARVGYSSQGPGRLSTRKPDVAAYTHFVGSGVYAADGGTSAACPVAAGVLAAVRTKYPVSALSPLQLRSLVQRTAADRGGMGYDFDYGWGVLDALKLVETLPTRRVPKKKTKPAKKTHAGRKLAKV